MTERHRMQSIALTALAAVSFWIGGAASPHAQATTSDTQSTAASGASLFRQYCAACHGLSARGDGPLAASLKRRPADLTGIAGRNGGTFPAEQVFRTIDGRQPVRGHGGPDMPVWGDAFKRAIDAGDENAVRSRIQAIVEYLATVQEKRVG